MVVETRKKGLSKTDSCFSSEKKRRNEGHHGVTPKPTLESLLGRLLWEESGTLDGTFFDDLFQTLFGLLDDGGATEGLINQLHSCLFFHNGGKEYVNLVVGLVRSLEASFQVEAFVLLFGLNKCVLGEVMEGGLNGSSAGTAVQILGIVGKAIGSYRGLGNCADATEVVVHLLPCEVFPKSTTEGTVRSSCGTVHCDGFGLGDDQKKPPDEWTIEKHSLFHCVDCGNYFSKNCSYCNSVQSVANCCWGCCYRRMVGPALVDHHPIDDPVRLALCLLLRGSGEEGRSKGQRKFILSQVMEELKSVEWRDEVGLSRDLDISQTLNQYVEELAIMRKRSSQTVCPSPIFMRELEFKSILLFRAKQTVKWNVKILIGLLIGGGSVSAAAKALIQIDPVHWVNEIVEAKQSVEAKKSFVLQKLFQKMINPQTPKNLVAAILSVFEKMASIEEASTEIVSNTSLALLGDQLVNVIESSSCHWSQSCVKSALRIVVKIGVIDFPNNGEKLREYTADLIDILTVLNGIDLDQMFEYFVQELMIPLVWIGSHNITERLKNFEWFVADVIRPNQVLSQLLPRMIPDTLIVRYFFNNPSNSVPVLLDTMAYLSTYGGLTCGVLDVPEKPSSSASSLIPNVIDCVVRNSANANVALFGIRFLLNQRWDDLATNCDSFVSELFKIALTGNSSVLEVAIKLLVKLTDGALCHKKPSSGRSSKHNLFETIGMKLNQLVDSCVSDLCCGEPIDESARLRKLWLIGAIVQSETNLISRSRLSEIYRSVKPFWLANEIERTKNGLAMIEFFGSNPKIREEIIEENFDLLINGLISTECVAKAVAVILRIIEGPILTTSNDNQNTGMSTSGVSNQRPDMSVQCRQLGSPSIVSKIQNIMLNSKGKLPSPDKVTDTSGVVMNCISIFDHYGNLGIVNPRHLPPVLLARWILPLDDDIGSDTTGNARSDVNVYAYRVFRRLYSKNKNANYLLSTGLVLIAARLSRGGLLFSCLQFIKCLEELLSHQKDETSLIITRLTLELIERRWNIDFERNAVPVLNQLLVVSILWSTTFGTVVKDIKSRVVESLKQAVNNDTDDGWYAMQIVLDEMSDTTRSNLELMNNLEYVQYILDKFSRNALN